MRLSIEVKIQSLLGRQTSVQGDRITREAAQDETISPCRKSPSSHCLRLCSARVIYLLVASRTEERRLSFSESVTFSSNTNSGTQRQEGAGFFCCPACCCEMEGAGEQSQTSLTSPLGHFKCCDFPGLMCLQGDHHVSSQLHGKG